MVIPPMDPPMTAATEVTPRESRTSLWILRERKGRGVGRKVRLRFRASIEFELAAKIKERKRRHRTYLTSSLAVVRGHSGPQGAPVSGLMVTCRDVIKHDIEGREGEERLRKESA